MRLGDDIDAFARLEHRTLIDADRAEHVRARSFHIFQVVGIIDDARRVRVLEIDAQREAVLVAHERTAVGLVAVASAHGPSP